MGPTVEPVPSSPDIPKEVDIAVIGGGIIGVMTALTLAERGNRVALFEKGTIAAEQSSRNWGWCRRTGRDLRELPLIVDSMAQWEDMNRRTGRETGFRKAGIIYASRTERDVERHRSWAAHAREHGIDSRILSPAEFTSHLPGYGVPVAGALSTQEDGRAEPQMAAPAMALAALDAGATIHQGVAVRTIERAAGRVVAVVTEKGRVRCSTVVVAGGAWSRLLLKGLGVELPQLKVRSNVLRTRPTSYPLTSAISVARFALRKRLDGGLTIATSASSQVDLTPDSLRFARLFLPAFRVEHKNLQLKLNRRFLEEAVQWRPGEADRPSVFEAVRILDPEPDAATIRRIVADVRASIPGLEGIEVAQSWAGMIDTMPDAIPVISPVDAIPGLFIGTGFSGHGFGIGPGAGRLLADLATGSSPAVDPRPFHIDRFAKPGEVRAQHWL